MSEQDNDEEDDAYKKLLLSMTGANDVPRWFSVSVTATGKIIDRCPMEGYECALMLLNAASDACEIHQKIAAETLVLDMLNGIPAGLGAFGCAVTTR